MAKTKLKSDELSKFMMPWEYYVCSECYQENPYAIWLVKQRCFKPHKHQAIVLVAVDRDSMAMVHIRPLPQHYSQFKGEFIQCVRHHTSIGIQDQRKLKCRYPHGEIEIGTWNIKKRMINGKHTYARYKKTSVITSFEFELIFFPPYSQPNCGARNRQCKCPESVTLKSV